MLTLKDVAFIVLFTVLCREGYGIGSTLQGYEKKYFKNAIKIVEPS
jgi:hypothetical protein